MSPATDEFQFFLEKEWSDGFPVVTPTEEPAFAGFTKYGRRSAFVTARMMRSRSLRQSCSRTGTKSTIGSFAAANAYFMFTLSIATADAVTPLPTYGKPRISR